jgi:hypothetical protein
MDPYSAAHLTESQLRITKALDAIYIYNQPQAGGGGFGPIIFGNVAPGQPAIEPASPKIVEGEPQP